MNVKLKEDPTVQTGLSMEQLKAQHQELSNHQSKVKELQKQAKTLNTKNTDIQSQVATVTKNLKAIYKATTGHQAVDKDGNDLSPLEMAKGITKAAKAAQESKAKADQDAEATEKKRKAAEQQKAQQEQQLAEQRTQLQTLQSQLSDTDDQLKQRQSQRIKNVQKDINDNHLTFNNNQPIIVNENNVSQLEQDLDTWHQQQRDNWQQDKQQHQTALDNLNEQLKQARTKKPI